MIDDLYYVRKDILDYDRSVLTSLYTKNHSRSLWKEQCLLYVNEAYHTLLFGCARASVIMSGEALYRGIQNKIMDIVYDKDQLKYIDNKKKKHVINFSHNLAENLSGEFNFHDVIGIL